MVCSLGPDLSRYQYKTNIQSLLHHVQMKEKTLLMLCVTDRSNRSRRDVSQRQLNNPCYQCQLHSRQNDRMYAYLPPSSRFCTSESQPLLAVHFERDRYQRPDSHLTLLRESPNNVRQCIVLALPNTRLQIDLLPLSSLQQPFICWPANIAAAKEMRPDQINKP